MMLEDFFTLAELKDGLTSPDRVKELMTVMQKEKYCVVENDGDASTQWDIVANVIAATKSKDCLDLFVESDGLWFVNRWLKDAHKFGNESGVHESTIALLTALDRLQMDSGRLVCCGILKNVLELVGHNDSGVHEKAKALCDKWMRKQDDETNPPVAVSPKPSADRTVGPGDTGDKDEEVVDSSGGDNSKWGVTERESGADDIKKHVGGQSEGDSGIALCDSKPSLEGEGGGGSSMEPDYRMVDPLEVVRKVAVEVEREDFTGGIESSDSRNGKESLLIGGSTKLASSGPGPGQNTMRINDGETTLGSVSEVAQESEAGFDLNQEGCSEEIEHPMDPVTNPISVVSSSRADILPTLRSEGNLGWKGSAFTSALRRTMDCGTSSNSKQGSDRLDIDLNVAEDGEDKIQVYSKTACLPSGEESSIEASPRRSKRLNLDLNSLGDGSVDNVVLNQNGCRSPSQSSSSSIMQPPMRNIDLNLNDQSVFPNDGFSNLGNLLNNPTASRGRDESALSLFGTVVENVIPQPPNRGMPEAALELGLGRSSGGCAVGSSMGVYGFPSMYYCSSPYGAVGATSPDMVGVPPQFAGSSSAFLAGGGSEDLNSSELMMNGGNRQVMKESSWVVGVKRKEPDGGWDGFSGDHKRQQPPWKEDPLA